MDSNLLGSDEMSELGIENSNNAETIDFPALEVDITAEQEDMSKFTEEEKPVLTPKQQAVLNKQLLDAAQEGGVDIVNTLVAAGADANTDMFGETALMYAAQEGHREIVDVLTDHNKRLGQIAEYIETLAIDKQSLFFAQGEKDQFMKDVTNFNKDNIISALTNRLVEKEISKQLESKTLRNDPATIEEVRESIKEEQLNKAKNAVEASIKTCKDEINKARTAKDATFKATALQEGGSHIRNDKKLVNNDTSAKILSFLSNEDREEARIAFAKRPTSSTVNAESSPPNTPAASTSTFVETSTPPASPFSKDLMRDARLLKFDAKQEQTEPNDDRKPAASPTNSPKGSRGMGQADTIVI